MADAAPGPRKCLLSTCNRSGPLQTFKLQAVKKIIECAIERRDNESLAKMQGNLDSQGPEVSVELHKNCYCTFTSKEHIKRFLARKRKEGSVDSEEPPTARVRRSQVLEFDFKDQCLFCGKVFKSLDPKHPDRWEKVIQCERKGVQDALPFKDAVLQYCKDRSDGWSREVSMRCHGVHDLSAAEAQYHVRCYDEFRKMPAHSEQTKSLDDKALQLLVEELYTNRKTCTWTSIELHAKYVSYNGQLTRKQMFTRLVTHLGEDAVVLCIEGCASILGFREYVGILLKVSKVETVDEEEEDAFVRKITTEAHAISVNNKNYDLGDFTHAKAKQQTSGTLLRFISKLTSNGEVTKASLSLSQAIQYQITKTRNQTTLGLGVKLHHKFGSRDLIDTLYEHGYTASYDEVLRFRKSAAKYVRDNAAMLHQMMGLTRNVGIIFGWYDNFDLFVSTPNGRRETHAMATEFQMHPAGIIECGSANPGISTLTIPRITIKQSKSVDITNAVPLLHYTGPKKVIPPAMPTRTTGVSYTDVCAQQASLVAAQDKDTQWLNSLIQGEDAIEWNGYNNQLARNQVELKPASIYMFGPLIDAPPSHPDTILTTLSYMQRSLADMGMADIHVCMDMQLYAVTKQVCWHQPVQFKDVITHPGGMHIIQSFLSCIAKLMKGSALEVYVAAAYGGLTGIFNGNSWVKAMRAFRGVSAALLKGFLSSGNKTFEEIEQYLETARLHPTGRHWVDNFLLPTLLIHQFERSEREGNIYLKHLTMKRMMKYFFLAGHVQYARYLTQYLLEMRAIPPESKVDLVCRHHNGYWNAVSADQFGEQTAIKIGKGGLKGMTLAPELVSEWINAFPITVHVADRMDQVYQHAFSSEQSAQKEHKEEMKHRRILDANDRNLIAAEVKKYPHPLENDRPHLCNPVTGQIAPNEVNVADSIQIGDQMECKYIASLPHGFYNAISSPIKTMHILKKLDRGDKGRTVLDLENIFLRLLLIGQRRQVELEPLFAYELCAVPSSLIDGHGCLRKGSKCGLVKRLGKIEDSPRPPDVVIVDVSQLFYHIVWPHGGTPTDLIASIQSRLRRYPDETDKIVVFDKYHNVSAKDHERTRRAGEVIADYELSITSALPKRDAILKSKNNKRMLASILCTFELGNNASMETKEDGVFGHDEADVTMVSYVLQAGNCGNKDVIRVLSDDTDVFVLLIYWVYRAELQCKVQMERWDGTVLDINATCVELGTKSLQLLGIHALSGCDTTSYPYGKGKISALNTLLGGNFDGLADVLGETGTTHTDLMEAAKPFFAALYGQPPETSMESARFTLFTKKKKNPKVMALPPTTANLFYHVLQAHHQVMLWKAAGHKSPPDESADITDFGWEMRDGIPVPSIAPGNPAPPELIDVIQCQCKAQNNRCSTKVCSCHKEHLSCTSCCACCGERGCSNPYTRTEDKDAGGDGSVEAPSDSDDDDRQGADFEDGPNQENDYTDSEWEYQ